MVTCPHDRAVRNLLADEPSCLVLAGVKSGTTLLCEHPILRRWTTGMVEVWN
jgi:hypothetical protein